MRGLLATPDRPASPGGGVSYRAQPFVCGAIGQVDHACLDRLRTNAPTDLIEVYRSPRAILLATTTTGSWRSHADRGYFWGSLADGGEPTSWRSAAERRVTAGLVETPESTILHADAAGLQDLFTRRIDGAIYFSIRIDPLLRLDDAKLHIDWTAWASIFAFTAPVSDTTPFVEVRRMGAASAWVADERGFHCTGFEPSWLSAEPLDHPSAAEIVAIVDACIPSDEHRIVPLSGGWDSRLLATLGRRHADRLVSWTTSEDDGRDRDLRLAPAVAEALGIEHHSLVPDAQAWLDELSPVRRRLDLQCTLHTWLMPLARVLHNQPGRILDGLAGDTIFKVSRFATPELVESKDPTERHRLLWTSLGQSRFKDPSRLAPGVAREFETLSRNSLVETVSRFDGHPAAATLDILHTRNSRSIGSMPLRLLAPEKHVDMPFLHPDVIESALRVPHTRKQGGGFYRDMLAAAEPTVARLPSSNDGRPTGRRGPKRQESRQALRAMAKSIRANEQVVRLLGTELRQALDDNDVLLRVGRSLGGHRQLNWASLFAEWRTTYADVLADDDGPT